MPNITYVVKFHFADNEEISALTSNLSVLAAEFSALAAADLQLKPCSSTTATEMFGCRPDDGMVPITFDELVESRSQANGEQPTSVWAVDGVAGKPPGAVRAAQVVTGSCG